MNCDCCELANNTMFWPKCIGIEGDGFERKKRVVILL